MKKVLFFLAGIGVGAVAYHVASKEDSVGYLKEQGKKAKKGVLYLKKELKHACKKNCDCKNDEHIFHHQV